MHEAKYIGVVGPGSGGRKNIDDISGRCARANSGRKSAKFPEIFRGGRAGFHARRTLLRKPIIAGILRSAVASVRAAG